MKKLKEIFQWIKKRQVELNIYISLAAIFISSFAVYLLEIYLAPGSAREFFELAKENYLILLLNYLPVIMLMLVLFFIFNNSILSISISSSLIICMSIVNRLKVVMRQDPFQPIDLTLVNEVFSIFKNFDLSYIIIFLGIILTIILIIFLSVSFFKGKKFNGFLRTFIIFILAGINVVLLQYVYKNDSLYNSFVVNGNIYFNVNQYNSKGFLYSFIHDSTKQVVQKPIGYNQNIFKEIENDFEINTNNDVQKPNIIMIMSESFSDISESELINFDGYQDPLENFKKISEESGSISGHIVVPGFGGGTSNTEFDVLTTFPTRYLNNSLASYSFIRKDFPALPINLKNIGYDTLAIHPGYPWFYNRLNVYKYFGFDNFLNLDNFDPYTQNKSGYISDEAATDRIIETFESHLKESENPLFSFTVTIQNHGPYGDKYGQTKNFNTDVGLSDEEYPMLSNYFFGVTDADNELGRLVEYFRNIDEPVILVFFGDHLPGFTNGMDYYEKLLPNININGTDEEKLNLYKTPFLIWQNESAQKMLNVSENAGAGKMSKNMTISANYLGSALTEMLGLTDISPQINFSNDLRKDLPVITNETFVNSDGEIVLNDELTEDELNNINKLKSWVYYELFEK